MATLSRNVFGPKQGLFGVRHHPKLAKIVHVTPSNLTLVHQSIAALKRKFNSASTRQQKVIVKEATVEAANIAQVSARRGALKPRTRANYHKIEKLYRDAANTMQLEE